MPIEQPGNSQTSPEHGLGLPKHMQWDMESWVNQKNQAIDPKTRRAYMPGMSTLYVNTDDLQHRVRDSLQPNIHRLVAEYLGKSDGQPQARFLDADPGDGLLASALQKQFRDMRVVGFRKHLEKHKLDSHLPPNATHVSQNVLEYVNFANAKEFTPDCIHLGHLPVTLDAKGGVRILQWAIEAVSDDGIVIVTLDDEDATDPHTQAGWRATCGIGASGNVAGIEAWAKRQQVGVRSNVVSLEAFHQNSPDELLAFKELLYAELPVDKRVKADAHMAKYLDGLRQGNSGTFRHNTRLMVLYANPDRAGATPAPAAGAADETARLTSGIGAVQASVKTVVAAAPKPVDTFEDTFKRWWAKINSKHERRFKQFTRDWKAGDAVKKTEMEAAVRAELKECSIPTAEQDKYFEAVMKHFGAVAVAPVATLVAAGAAPVVPDAPVAVVAPLAPQPEKASAPSMNEPLSFRTATVAQVLARMEYISSEENGGGVGIAFDRALQAAGWSHSDWRLLNEHLALLERAQGGESVLPFLTGTVKPRSTRPAAAPAAPVKPSAAPVMQSVPFTPKPPAGLRIEEATPAEVRAIASRSGEVFHIPGGRFATSDALAQPKSPATPVAAPASLKTPAPAPAPMPKADSADVAVDEELFVMTLTKVPVAARAEVQTLLNDYRELRGAGHHHYSAEELHRLAKLVFLLREFGHGIGDVERLTDASHATVSQALEDQDALSPAETVAFAALQKQLEAVLPAKGQHVHGRDLRGCREQFAAFCRLWRKAHGNVSSMAEGVSFAVPDQATISALNGEFRNQLTRDLAPDAFPQEPEEGEIAAEVNNAAPVRVQTTASSDAPASAGDSVSSLAPSAPVSVMQNTTDAMRLIEEELASIPVALRQKLAEGLTQLTHRSRVGSIQQLHGTLLFCARVFREYGQGKAALLKIIGMANNTMDDVLAEHESLDAEDRAAFLALEAMLAAQLPAKGSAKRVAVPESLHPHLAAYVRLWRKQGHSIRSLGDHAAFALPIASVLSHIEAQYEGVITSAIVPQVYPEHASQTETQLTDVLSNAVPADEPVHESAAPSDEDVLTPDEDVSPNDDVPENTSAEEVPAAPYAEPAQEVIEADDVAPPLEIPAVPEAQVSEAVPVQPVGAVAEAESVVVPAAAEKQTDPVAALQVLVQQQRLQIEQLMAQVQALQAAPKSAAAPDVQKTRVVINHPNGTQSVLTIEGNAPAVLFLPPETEARGTLEQ